MLRNVVKHLAGEKYHNCYYRNKHFVLPKCSLRAIQGITPLEKFKKKIQREEKKNFSHVRAMMMSSLHVNSMSTQRLCRLRRILLHKVFHATYDIANHFCEPFL